MKAKEIIPEEHIGSYTSLINKNINDMSMDDMNNYIYMFNGVETNTWLRRKLTKSEMRYFVKQERKIRKKQDALLLRNYKLKKILD